MKHIFVYIFLLSFLSCQSQAGDTNDIFDVVKEDSATDTFQRGKVIHVMVALCDNESQGIVPVPAKIGNGEDPNNNLYWGCGYGVRSYFKNSSAWQLVQTINPPNADILERCVFKSKTSSYYLVADAYRGREIKQCMQDYFESAVGNFQDSVTFNETVLQVGRSAQLLAYVGHNGFMEFDIELGEEKNKADRPAELMALACYSGDYFKSYYDYISAKPRLFTTGLMAPEAYTLEAIINAWIKGENGATIREAAAQAYHKYQKCGINGARNLFIAAD